MNKTEQIKYLESSKRYYYLSAMKNLKIAEGVHSELKIFAAKNFGGKMADWGGLFIMEGLKSRGHQFTKPKANSPKSKKP